MWSPTFRTTINPSPEVTTLPRKSWFFTVRSQSSAPFWRVIFTASLLSPFSADWSTRSSPEIRMPSAGTRSPACNSTRSPTTISDIRTESTPSRRLTRHWILAASSCNFRKADSLPYSDRVETKVARKIASAIPTVSNQFWLRRRKSRFTASAARRILMIGSPKLSRNCCQNPLRRFRVNWFSPCSIRARSTSDLLSPPIEWAVSLADCCPIFSSPFF